MDRENLKNVPILDDGQTYIYVIRNSAGNIKIGKTTNIAQRVQSLSASNSGGMTLENYYCSPATWVHNIEMIAHDHFSYARLSGEWFDGTKVSFDEAVEYVSGLFESKDYERCNELRKRIYKEKRDWVVLKKKII